mgnify:CR=1 FL=1
MREIRMAIQHLMESGITNVSSILNTLSSQGFDREAVTKELIEMVGPAVHPEDRLIPSLQDLAEIGELRKKLEKH